MKNIDWNKWAAISEVIGTIAVVVSLAFVVQSVNQNTKALQNENLNHVYDRYDSQNADIAADPELSVLHANKVLGIKNIEADEARFLYSLRRELNQWEQYYDWHLDGLLDDNDWRAWDDYFKLVMSTALPEEWWRSLRRYHNDAFSSHVDQIYNR